VYIPTDKMMTANVYKIENDVDDRIYVGSTRNLKRRFRTHKSQCNNKAAVNYHCKLYQCMRELGKDHFTVHILETVEYFVSDEILFRERHYIEQLTPALNTSLRPILTDQELLTKRRESYLKLIAKPGYKERKKKYDKDYTNRPAAKAVRALYMINNADKIKAIQHTYYTKNKAAYVGRALDRYQRLKANEIVCACGAKTNEYAHSQHLKSVRHIRFMAKN